MTTRVKRKGKDDENRPFDSLHRTLDSCLFLPSLSAKNEYKNHGIFHVGSPALTRSGGRLFHPLAASKQRLATLLHPNSKFLSIFFCFFSEGKKTVGIFFSDARRRRNSFSPGFCKGFLFFSQVVARIKCARGLFFCDNFK